MNNYKIAIIGGGPSGMIAAIKAAQDLEGGEDIVLIEKNDTLGKKLLLTGGGRCNIANKTPLHDQIKYYGKNKNFIKHALYTLTPEKLLEIFEDEGISFHTEDNKRVFPDDEDSEVILDVLEEYLDDLDVNILLECEVNPNSIEHELDENLNPIFTFEVDNHEINSKENITCEKLIVATGGITYPTTGSTGDGYKIAKNLNHSITQIKPGLVSFEIDDFLLTTLSGMVLENVEVSFKDKKKKIKEKGNVLITHNGISGPAIMDISNKLLEKSDYDLLREEDNTLFKDKINIDLTPDLTEEAIKEQITKDTPSQGTTKIKNYLKIFLPTNFIDYFLMTIAVSSNKTMASITKKDKNKIAQTLKSLELTIDNLVIDTSKVTIGGVKSEEINSKTLESKYVEGLYFVGELLEIAGPTGGYNLEIAFSTGYLAAQEVVKSLQNKN